jgi:Flp pilus assembly protein TadD
VSHGRVKVKVPKHRRNSGEVRPYNELPGRRNSKSDSILLWGVTGFLGIGLLLLGGLMLRKSTQAGVAQPEVIQVGPTDPKELLAQSRQEFIRGDFSRALSQARMGLALEQQKPSDPPLEMDLRRAVGLADLEQRDFGEAVEHFSWLKSHGGSADDLSNLTVAQNGYRQVTDEAMQELEGAQRLSVSGVQDKAYAKASKAVTSLQKSRGQAAQVQAGHLVMANIALRQGQYKEALLRLREAQKLGSLTAQQQQILRSLEATHPDRQKLASAQMPVLVPRLETGADYPHGRPGVRTISHAAGRKPAPEAEPELPDIPETAGVAPPPRRVPHLELPKLQFPGGGQNSNSSGGIPGYQNNNSSRSLPGYNTQTRPRDTLPGY